MKYKNHDQEYRTAEDQEHPSIKNVKEFGYHKTTNIRDEFKYTLTKYSCPICKKSTCSPYAYTSDIKSLSEIFEKLAETTETVEAQRVSHHGVS